MLNLACCFIVFTLFCGADVQARAQTLKAYTISPSAVEQGKQYELTIKSARCATNDLLGADLIAPLGSGISIEMATGVNDCLMLARISVTKDAPAETVVLRVVKQDVVLGLIDLSVKGIPVTAPSPTVVATSSPEPAQPESPSPVVIEKISWSAVANRPSWSNRGAAFSIDVKNTSDKMVIAVHWDFYIIDSVRQRVYDHFKFVTDDKQIGPDQKIRLTKRFEYHKTPSYARGRAVIRKLIYSDGSTWTMQEK